MTTQQQMTEAQVVALWLGDFDSFEELDAYMLSDFEREFGFRLNDRAMPEISEPTGAAQPIQELLTGFSFSRGWFSGAVAACEERGIRAAKAAVLFHHLRYQPALRSGIGARMTFVGNIPWRDEEAIQPLQTTTGSSAPDRV